MHFKFDFVCTGSMQIDSERNPSRLKNAAILSARHPLKS